MTKIRNYLKVPIHIHPKIYIRDKSFYDTHHIYFLGEAPNCRYITNRTFVVKPPGNPVVAIYFHKFRLRFVLAVSVPITKQRRPIPIAGQLGNKQKRQTFLFSIAWQKKEYHRPSHGLWSGRKHSSQSVRLSRKEESNTCFASFFQFGETGYARFQYPFQNEFPW